MSLAAQTPALAAQTPAPPAVAPAAAVSSPGILRGPLLLVVVLGMLAAGIAVFVSATEKRDAPAPTLITVVTNGSGRGPAPLLAHTP